MDQKEKYSLFINRFTTPIFYWPEWLEAVCGDIWKVELFKNLNGEIIAALPYILTTRKSFKILESPPYTPYLGIIDYITADKAQTFLKQGYDNVGVAIKFLNGFDAVNFRSRPGFSFWLPFRWAGYKLDPRITYRIYPDSEAILWGNLDPRVRTDIRKAKDKLNISIQESQDLQSMYHLYNNVFESKGRKTPMTYNWFLNFDKKLLEYNLRKILCAKDATGTLLSMAYLVEDNNSIYLFLTGISPEHRKSSSLSLVIWEAIQMAAMKNKVFDFEGSILPDVEYFFRGFGGKQEVFFDVSKTNNKYLLFLKKIIKSIK